MCTILCVFFIEGAGISWSFNRVVYEWMDLGSSCGNAKDRDLALWMGPGSHRARKRLWSSVNVLVPWTSLQIPDRVFCWFFMSCESELQQVLLVVPPSATSTMGTSRSFGITP